MLLMLRLIILVVAVILLGGSANAQMYFPPLEGDEWETVSLSELNWDESKLDTLLNFVDANDTKAFIILKDGKIAVEWYEDGFLPADFWYWASAGKTVTATLIGIAQKEGLLDIDNSTSTYLGEGWTSLSKEQEETITVWHQLTMTSGLDDRVDDAYCTDPECLVFKTEPGTRWAYHNAPYTLLDNVIESSTGGTLNQYYTSALASKVGMNGLYIKNGFNKVLTTTPRSMARFGLLALNDFVWNGTPILDDADYVNDMITRSQELNKSYGYLWWLNGQESHMLPGTQIVFGGPITPNAPADAYNGIGKNSQLLSVVPSEGLVMVRMGEPPSQDGSLVPTVFVNRLWGLISDMIRTPTSVEEEGDTELSIQRNGDEIFVHSSRGPLFLTTSTGEVVRSSRDETISVSGLATGVYFLVDQGSGTAIKILR